MRSRTLSALTLADGGRLDPGHHLSPGSLAAEKLRLARARGIGAATLGGLGGIAEVFHPHRFKRTLAAPGEPSIPFLRAFDVFEYLPQPADYLSLGRTRGLKELRVAPETILVTRSGRNLGPVVMADSYLSSFILSDDLIRVRIPDDRLRYYTLAYLQTPTGQELLRRDKTGSVIDHLSRVQVEMQSVPLLEDRIITDVAREASEAHALRGQARQSLSWAVSSISDRLPSAEPPRPLSEGWEASVLSLRGRLDAAPNQRHLAKLQHDLLASGGVQLGAVARVMKPSGRYKTYYVSAEHGRPILSGRQLLQSIPIGLRYISERSFDDAAKYLLAFGMIAFQADGRAEERLGFPVVVTPDRDGWLASGHVGRLVVKDLGHAGWLWAAFATPQVQAQVASIACGSVVDALYEDELEKVVLPPVDPELSSPVLDGWRAFTEAGRHDHRAMSLIESQLPPANDSALIL
jgi:hypothetical protein